MNYWQTLANNLMNPNISFTYHSQNSGSLFPSINAPGRGTEHDQPQSFFQTPASVQQCALAHCGQQRNPCWPRSHPHGGLKGMDRFFFFFGANFVTCELLENIIYHWNSSKRFDEQPLKHTWHLPIFPSSGPRACSRISCLSKCDRIQNRAKTLWTNFPHRWCDMTAWK